MVGEIEGAWCSIFFTSNALTDTLEDWMARHSVRRLLQAVALICLIIFVVPGYAYDVTPNQTLVSVRLGLISPWAAK